MALGKSPQLLIEFGAVRNSDLFSNNWVENRLPLEPEWDELRADAFTTNATLAELWKVQKKRVEKYDGEPMLEEQFIQPVLRALGWKDRMLYQTFLRGRKPDYALFLDTSHLDAALENGKSHPGFWENAVVLADAKAWAVPLDRKATIDAKREHHALAAQGNYRSRRQRFGRGGQRHRRIERHRRPGILVGKGSRPQPPLNSSSIPIDGLFKVQFESDARMYLAVVIPCLN